MRTIDQITKDLHNLAIETSIYYEKIGNSNKDPIYIESCVMSTKTRVAELISLGIELRRHIAANNTPLFNEIGESSPPDENDEKFKTLVCEMRDFFKSEKTIKSAFFDSEKVVYVCDGIDGGNDIQITKYFDSDRIDYAFLPLTNFKVCEP